MRSVSPPESHVVTSRRVACCLAVPEASLPKSPESGRASTQANGRHSLTSLRWHNGRSAAWVGSESASMLTGTRGDVALPAVPRLDQPGGEERLAGGAAVAIGGDRDRSPHRATGPAQPFGRMEPPPPHRRGGGGALPDRRRGRRAGAPDEVPVGAVPSHPLTPPRGGARRAVGVASPKSCGGAARLSSPRRRRRQRRRRQAARWRVGGRQAGAVSQGARPAARP